MATKLIWIVLADGMNAKFFESLGRGRGLKEIAPGGLSGRNLPGREIMADRPGRAFDSHGEGRHAMGYRTPPRQVEKQRFVSEVVSWLDDPKRRNRYDQLAIVAPPRVLGEFRSAMPRAVRAKVVFELGKDLLGIPKDRLIRVLRDARLA